MPYVVIKNGKNAGRKFPIKGTSTSFGRLDECVIKLDDQNVSRVHAFCDIFENSVTVLIDNNSSNGTYVNGLPISRIFLMDGDEIRMGETLLEFHDEESSADHDDTVKYNIKFDQKKIMGKFSSASSPDTFMMEPAQYDAEMLRETFQKLRAINILLVSLAKCETLEDAAKSISDGLFVSTPAQRLIIFLYDSASGEMQPHQSFTYKEIPEKINSKFPLNKEVVSALMKEKQPAMFFTSDDMQEDNAASEKKCRYIGSPVIRNSNIVSLLVADIYEGKKFFSRNDLDLLYSISSHLGEIIGRLIEMEKLRRKTSQMESYIAGDLTIICRNPKMREIMNNLGPVAESDCNVLVTGESGTGKEMIARAVHYFSKRRHNPIVCINCASLPETLIESELFGFEKGAFTGAVSKKPGKFELANEGTIFLDEVGDIPLSAQAKLLRVIQEGELERLGGAHTIKINVRIICATNKDLEKEVAEKKFREDLFYRINVVRIHIPPLRERIEDLPAISQHFLKTLKQKITSPAVKFSDEVTKLFLDYKWPGNIRELHNIIERCLVFCNKEEITPEYLPAEMLKQKSLSIENMANNTNGILNGEYAFSADDKDLSLLSAEKRHIMKVLAFVNGNKQKAAALLKISRTTLYDKLKEIE